MRQAIYRLIESIQPLDPLEAEHLSQTMDWTQSGADLFRIEKPATPPKHLVAYMVLLDPAKQKILLVSHIKAGLWLPAGGHVEKDEHPKLTAQRELAEELNLLPEFLSEAPLFLTQTVTVGKTAGHTDVSLWYVLKGDSREELVYDQTEFNGYRWFGYDEILDGDLSDFDPHMHRFVRKLINSELLRVTCLS